MSWMNKYGEQIESPRSEPRDAKAIERMRDLIMSGLAESGWTHREIATLFHIKGSGTVAKAIQRIPPEARRWHGETKRVG